LRSERRKGDSNIVSEAEQDAMEVAEELRKALAVKNREVAEKDAEIARLQRRYALLDSLLGECIRHHYYDDTEVSQKLAKP
jgi:hypothetical protein